MTRRRHIIRALIALAAAAWMLVPVVALAAPEGPSAGQRINLKVLLLTPATSDGVFAAWQDTLSKLGVSYDTYVAGQPQDISDATLADYTTGRANYQAVILASSAVSLTTAERTALDKLETTFGVREISDNTNPDSAHGATLVGRRRHDGDSQHHRHPDGCRQGRVPVPEGQRAARRPVFRRFGHSGPELHLPLNAPDGSSYMGVWKRPNGTEQLVDGIPGNGQQSHYQLLRFGMLNWVTRGVYLGYWRNYFEVQVDDLFLGDDAWDPATHANNYDPVAASRMVPSDLSQALTWSQANKFRLDFAYNAGGHAEYETEHGAGSDLLWNAFATGPQFRSGFGFINHTYDHAFLGCSSQNYITSEITQNVSAGLAIGLPVNPAELITGEHSGLANTRPGNPGVLDPPSFNDLTVLTDGRHHSGRQLRLRRDREQRPRADVHPGADHHARAAHARAVGQGHGLDDLPGHDVCALSQDVGQPDRSSGCPGRRLDAGGAGHAARHHADRQRCHGHRGDAQRHGRGSRPGRQRRGRTAGRRHGDHGSVCHELALHRCPCGCRCDRDGNGCLEGLSHRDQRHRADSGHDHAAEPGRRGVQPAGPGRQRSSTPSRATRPTSTTTPPLRGRSSTSTTGSTRRLQVAAAVRTSRTSRPATRRP